MYNGIGLQTARGSGTNGYVQRNLGHVRRNRRKTGYRRMEEHAIPKAHREPNAEILEHQRKRQVEVKCMELQVEMEDRGYVARTLRAHVLCGACWMFDHCAAHQPASLRPTSKLGLRSSGKLCWRKLPLPSTLSATLSMVLSLACVPCGCAGGCVAKCRADTHLTTRNCSGCPRR